MVLEFVAIVFRGRAPEVSRLEGCVESKSPLKSKPLRNPGESLDEQIKELINDTMLQYYLFPLFFWLIAGLEWFANWRHMPRMPGTYAFVAGVATLWGGARFYQLRQQVRALRQGRDGEKAVGQFLERLRADGAQVFHDVPGEGFNLDHVVICSKGIFAIETKTYSKSSPNAKVTFDGEQLLVSGYKPDRDPVRQVRAEAKWLLNLLRESTSKTFPIRGVVLFPGWYVDPVPEGIKRDTWVLEPKALPTWIERESLVMDATDVSLAAFHLSRYIRSSE